ncbi:hypothetical protein OG548_08155 [Streptomyces sp. NBC_01356]|uniref:hypothetical protein n=1 Tax=Streptomyces sp. NBC_01356 TaxID=2903836 RepID=UPI002E37C680|nr:hypothetical protein [Streptomyces sp. NBC_01356]
MGKRGVVSDYAGEELYAGDLVTFAARHGNRVRMSDALVLDVTTKKVAGRLLPTLLVQPMGVDSGWALGARKTLRPVEISAEHVRLVTPDFANAAAG